jgi:hypothetical protein
MDRKMDYSDPKLLKNGERGRNRTYNLLTLRQLVKLNGFNGFPSSLESRNGQI